MPEENLMDIQMDADEQVPTRQELNKIILPYTEPRLGSAIWQLINTMLPYAVLWAMAIFAQYQGYPRWVSLIPTLVAAPFLVRIFIIFHDCCHSSFFKEKWANGLTGYLTGILVSSPFKDWGTAHIRHHATAGNLDKRGVGDIWTLTVDEYIEAPRLKRLTYRVFRNPISLFIFGPAYVFLVFHRFSQKSIQHKGRLSVLVTNFGLLALLLLGGRTIGYANYLWIYLPVTIVAGTLGVWLFYVQHQYEEVYWARNEVRDSLKAALEGSSYYKLPKVAQWFSGNIGLHHIHHLNPSIPNYNLQACHEQIQQLHPVSPLGIRKSLKSIFIHLWDEQSKKLVSFRAMRKIRKNRRSH